MRQVAHDWLNDPRPAADAAPLALAQAPDQARALVWALKDATQAAWSTAPTTAQRAAACARWLADAHVKDREIAAAADWLVGLAAIVQGRMSDALDALASAQQAFDDLALSLPAAQVGVPQLMVRSLLGRHDEAIAQAQSLGTRLAQAGDRLGAAKVVLNLGSLLLRQDRLAEAAAAYRRASVAFARLADAEHSIMADIGMATTLLWQSRWPQAQALLSRAHQRARARGLPVLEGLALGELGQLALHRGDRRGALRALGEARAVLDGRAHPQRLLEADRALADACLAIGLLPEARQRYAAVIDAATALNAPLEAAWARVHRAQALVQLGDGSAADADLEQATAAFHDAGNPVGAARAATLRAARALASGDPAAALAHAEAAARTLEEAGLRGWALEARFAVSRALAALGRWDEARACTHSAQADAEGRPQAPWAALLAAEQAQACGQPCEDAYVLALSGFERLRAALPAGELRLAATRDAEIAADALVQLAAARADAVAMWQRMEAARSRALHEAWAAGETQPAFAADERHIPRDDGGDESSSDRSDARALHRRWQWLQQQLARALVQAAPVDACLRGRIAEVESELRQSRRATALAAPVLAQAQLQATTVPLSALQAALGPQRLLVEYHLLEGGQAWACVIRSQGVRAVAIDGAALQPLLALLREQLAAQAWPGALEGRHAAQRVARCQAVLERLYAVLVAPWAGDLPGCTQCVIVAHRTLHSLPWSALHDGHAPWVQQMELVVAPSATVWWHCAQRQPADGTAVLMAAGDAALPATAQEVQEAARHLGPQVRLLLDEAATTAALRREAPAAALLHLACHASARADAPEFSALHLADGPFTADEAASLGLRASVAVLSACDTAWSAVAPGDEALGLARGFLLGGARSVLASLWAVPDAPTAQLMSVLHAAGASRPAAALRAAQCAQVARGAPPLHWAGFVCVGSG